jgi:hypothetical protein
MKISKNMELSILPKSKKKSFSMVRISHVSTKFHFFNTEGYGLKTSITLGFSKFGCFAYFKKKVVWASETILVKSHLWVKMKKKMEIKQHAHVVKTMAPYPFMGML